MILSDFSKSNDERTDNLEEYIKTIEEGNKHDIKESVIFIHGELLESLKGDIDNLVDLIQGTR